MKTPPAILTQPNASAYSRGRLAGLFEHSQNPYPPGSGNWQDWQRGVEDVRVDHAAKLERRQYGS